MRLSQQEMIRNHERIVEGASRIIRGQGIQNTSVSDAMRAAGMTHGGFYRHFSGKDDLLLEALAFAFEEFLAPLEQAPHPEAALQAIKSYKSMYVSPEHAENPGLGCPMPALGAEVSRANEDVKAVFSEQFNRLVTALSKAATGTERAKRKTATRELATMVGAVLLARATDPDTAKTILKSCAF